MREQCYHCMTIRERAKLIELTAGVWFCRSTEECKAFIARLPDWLKAS